MGLDMYLSARKFIAGGGYGLEKQQQQYDIFTTAAGLTADVIEKLPATRSAHLEIEVGYWRKAHELHDWFVSTVQDGNDNCAPYYVSRENLEELRENIKEVLADPSEWGSVFSVEESTDFDEWAKEVYENTAEMIDLWLSPAFDGWDFVYMASW